MRSKRDNKKKIISNKRKKMLVMRRAEDEYITIAARVELSENEIDRLRNIPVQIKDWDIVFNKAVMHGVSGILYYAVKKYGLEGVLPEGIFERLRIKFYETALRNTYAERTVNEIGEVCGEKIVLLKGAYLFKYLYPASGMRFLSDVDVFASKERAVEVMDKLLKSGYRRVRNAKSRLHDRLSDEHHHLPQIHNKNFKVEIHRNLFGGDKFEDVAAEAFETAERLEGNLYALTPEMNVVHFCCHFIHHINKGSDLKMLCDINEVVRKFNSEFSWEKVESVSDRLKSVYDITVPLTYARMLLETPVHERLLNERIMESEDLGLDDIMRDEGVENTESVSLRRDLRKFGKVHEKLIFLFRHFVPRCGYVNYVFGIYDDRFRVSLYWRYYKRVVRARRAVRSER